MRAAFLTATAATAAAWIPPILFGLRWPEYQAGRDYISELGAAGAPDAGAVNVAFLVAGALFVAACAALAREWRRHWVSLALVSFMGWSYVVAAVVPCDAGCPANGSPTQALHNGAGALGYLAAAVGLLMLARAPSAPWRGPRWLATLAGITVIAGLMAMGAPELADVRGAAQRLVEAAVFLWLLAAARAAESRSGSLEG